MPTKTPPFKRLYQNINENESGCWEWLGQKGSSGYGQIKAFGKMVNCHRMSYELYFGAIPSDKEVMHTCHNRICINPSHLTVGTHAENMNDASKNNSWAHVKRIGVSGINRSQSKPVLVLGQYFGSINEAEKTLGLGSGSVSYWIKSKSNKAQLITREKYLEKTNG